MDKKKIIEDGILELYLLGELQPGDEEMVAHAIQSDPDLLKVYKILEEDFERMAFENAIDPPGEIRQALAEKIKASDSGKGVIPLDPADKKRTSWRTLYPVAASLAILFGLSSLWLYDRWHTAEQNLQVLQEKTSEMEQRLEGIENNYEEVAGKYQKINSPDVTPLLLAGNDKLPEGHATAYINHSTKEVLLNPQGLPALSSDKTYQLWADVDGEMIDMGLVPTDKELVAVRYVDRAVSLNITVEPAGGSEHPTVANLVANALL